ncbi:MAG: hypothetical protein HYW63_01805 [Candidatus Levybacteria bacterium]|nr:hypothetical protein [Candidatus Levybacteria bacterium]
MAIAEYGPRSSDGTPTVDSLEAIYISIWSGNANIASRLRPRIAAIPFSPYWSDRFKDFATLGRYNVVPGQLFAQTIYEVSKQQEGEELNRTVAIELGIHSGEAVLEAAIDLPLSPEAVSLPELDLEPLPQALLAIRLAIETSKYILHPAPRVISDSWIYFIQRLASEDSIKYSALSAELMRKLGNTAIEVQSIRAEEAGLLGGFNDFNRDHEISCAIAEVLAHHFPTIVLQGLTEAPKYVFYEPRLGGRLNPPVPEEDLLERNVSPVLTE